jgi:C-terminal processing protease CtpA/Prc
VQAGDELVAVGNIAVHGSTMGQVWAMLGGTPGQDRQLTIERAGKEFVVPAKVQHFLATLPEEDGKKKKK